jgi:uncharacterized membrane protein
MFNLEFTLTINKPSADVFAFVGNPTNVPKWQEGVIESRIVSSGPIGVGTQIVDKRKVLGLREVEATLEVTAFEPNKKYAWKIITGPTKVQGSVILEPATNGTKVSILIQAEPVGLNLPEDVMQKQMETQIKGNLERLKKVLEG